jgi:outer membrane lipoprotein carrier protein
MTRNFALTVTITACMMVVHTPGHGQHSPARAELEQFADGLETLHAAFDQRVLSGDGSVEDQSSGEVWLQRPKLFRWEYGGDFPELVVADGSQLWIYDEVLEQVTVRDQSGLSSDSPLTLLTDMARLDEQFEVRDLGENEGMKLLELRSNNPESQFDRVLLGLQDSSLKQMAMEDAFGFRTEVNFRDIERNGEVDPGLFHFEPPANVDVIGDLPGGYIER